MKRTQIIIRPPHSNLRGVFEIKLQGPENGEKSGPYMLRLIFIRRGVRTNVVR